MYCYCLFGCWILDKRCQIVTFTDFLSFKSLLWFVKGNEILLSDWWIKTMSCFSMITTRGLNCILIVHFVWWYLYWYRRSDGHEGKIMTQYLSNILLCPFKARIYMSISFCGRLLWFKRQTKWLSGAIVRLNCQILLFNVIHFKFYV